VKVTKVYRFVEAVCKVVNLSLQVAVIEILVGMMDILVVGGCATSLSPLTFGQTWKPENNSYS
jgi:3-oxoacyl-(acyl-carrier-protein) synthase